MISARKALFGGFSLVLVAMAAMVLAGGGARAGSSCGACPTAFDEGPKAAGGCGANEPVVLSAAEEAVEGAMNTAQEAVEEALDTAAEAADGDETHKPCAHCQARREKLLDLKSTIEAARAAVVAENKTAALAELDKAGEMIKALTAPPKVSVVNDRCPIMGSKIDRTAVPATLTREFGGNRVGFCCAGCPEKWDALSDAEKRERLDKAIEPK